jgi:hypothetical protein
MRKSIFLEALRKKTGKLKRFSPRLSLPKSKKSKVILVGSTVLIGSGVLAWWLSKMVTGSNGIAHDDKVKILDFISTHEGDFDDLNLDYEFEGWFDKPKKDSSGNKIHPSKRMNYPGYKPNSSSKYGGSKPRHVGISVGFIQNTQQHSLDVLINQMFEDDPQLFKETFGDCWQALIDLVNADAHAYAVTDHDSHTGVAMRSDRVKSLCGAELWQSPWKERFAKAGTYPVFQQSQLKAAITRYFDRAVESIAIPLGFHSEKAVAFIVDTAINRGRGGAETLIRKYASDTDLTEEQRLTKVAEAAGKSRMWDTLNTNTLSWNRGIV